MGRSGLERSTVGSGRRRVLASVAVFVLALAGCSDDDDDTSTQEAYCEAGQTLESSVNSLSGLVVGDGTPGSVMDSVVEGRDDLDSALDAVKADLDALREAATDAAADEVDALKQAVDGLDEAFSELVGDLSVEKATAAQEAFQGVEAAAGAVTDALTDCS